MDNTFLSESLCRVLFDNLADVTFLVFDHELRHTLVKGGSLAALGVTGEAAAITGQTLAQALPAASAARLEPLYRAALAGETSQMTGVFGSRMLHIRSAPVFDEAQVTAGAIIIHDMTQHQQTEDTLHTSEQRYRVLFEQTNDAVFIIDFDGCFVETNQRAADMFGYSLDEMKSLSFHKLVAPSELSASENVMALLLAGERLPVYERTFVRQDGELLIAEVNVTLVCADDGTPLCIQSILRDITTRKQAEKQLAQSEERYRTLTELISDFAYSFLVNEDGTTEDEWITEDSFLRITGYTLAEIRSLPPFTTWHPEDRALVQALRQRVMQGETISGVHRLVTKSGEVRWMRVHRRPVWDDEKKRVVRFYGVAQDVTEQKQAEEALRRSEQRYRIISELISDYAYCFEVDEDGSEHLEWITVDSFTRVTGYAINPRELASLKENFSLFHPLDIDRARQHHEEVMQGIGGGHDYRIITRQGEHRWLHIHRYPIRDDEQKRVARFYAVAQDITERKQAEEALRRQEDLLNQSQRIANIGGWELDLFTNQLTWTRQTYVIHELPFDYQPTVDTAIEFYAPQSQPLIRAAVEQALQGTPYDLELEVITASGRLIWVRTIGQVEMVDGRAVRLYGTFQDITESRQAQMLLRESEERYRRITELIYDYAFAVKIIHEPEFDSVIEWITEESYQRITGYAFGEVSQRDLIYPDDYERVEQDIDAALHGQENTTVLRIITRSGALRWLQVNRYPEFDPHTGQAVRYYGVAQDITEQKQAEEALRHSEERFRLIAQVTLDGLYDFNIPDEEYWLSVGYMRLLGLKEVPPKMFDWWLAHIHPEDQPVIKANVDEVFAGRLSHWSQEYRFQRGTDDYVIISDRGYVIPDENGDTDRIIGAVTDITQQREAEKRALEFSLAREKMRLFTDFITAISHDFRTPLSVINTSLYLLERAQSQQDRRQHLGKLRHQADHIAGLVDGLLTMAQLDKPEALDFAPLDVNHLLNYIRIREEEPFASAGITLSISPASDLPLIMADHNWLYRCLLNLVENARLYSQPGGRVEIATRLDEDHVLIEIVDDGIGIPPEHLPHVFDPLYRVETHRPTGGQGLGLSIAHKIVQQHGGEITLSSKPSAGTRLQLTLPTQPPISRMG